jgi:hypothetical protein
MGPYLDTSALAKWYLNEPRSEEFAAFIQQQTGAAISHLTRVEMRCLLARRRRNAEISRVIESRSLAALQKDIGAGFLELIPVADAQLQGALGLIEALPRHPLRTLDAVHLAIARSAECAQLATADKTMADAASALGFEVFRFC